MDELSKAENISDEEFENLEIQRRELEMNLQQWLINFENRVADEERLLEEKEIHEENKFLSNQKNKLLKFFYYY